MSARIAAKGEMKAEKEREKVWKTLAHAATHCNTLPPKERSGQNVRMSE